MATETHTTTTRKGYSTTHVKSNNPKRNNAHIVRPTGPATAGNFAPNRSRVHYTSVSTGNRVSRSGANLGRSRHANLPKALGVTPQARTAKKVATRLPRPHLPESDKRTTSFIGKATDHSPVLVAEYFIAMFVVVAKGISDISRNGYQVTISGIMLRFTAITATWFVLFLLSTGKRGSTFAAWFGALVTLGIIFDATQKQNAVADLVSFVKGQGLTDSSGKTVTTISDSKPEEFYETIENDGQMTGGTTV